MLDTTTSFERLLSHFKIKSSRGNNHQAFCPAHEDTNASLSITLSGDKALLFCFAGCHIDDILKSANLTYADLFLGEHKPSNIYQYRDVNGQLAYEKVKYKTADGKKTFKQRHISDGSIVDNLEGIAKIPYNYPAVKEQLNNSGLLLYVEGEKDADTAKMLNYTATTMGGASDWKAEYANFFKGASIVLFPDKDDPGLKLTQKMINDLKVTVKSLKVVVLPTGKDLTEWVEAGNQDLQKLIDSTQPEYTEPLGIPEPIMVPITGGYKLGWRNLNLEITIDNISDGNDSEITVIDNGVTIYISGFKLLSISHKADLARALKKQKNVDWDKILNQVTTRVLAQVRKGEPLIWLTEEYGRQAPEYLLKPLFVKHAPNIIYADQSSAKSLFMTLIDIILTLPEYRNKNNEYFSNMFGLYNGTAHRVLFLDWENNPYITGWTKQCLLRGLDGMGGMDIPLAYLHCHQPLHKLVGHVQQKIDEAKADIVIIDSLGMAVGADLNLTEPAFAFFGALRQLPVTPLIIAHTSKSIENRHKTVYGNAYYSNESRSIWEINKVQEQGSPELTITLFNRKPAPFTPLHSPLAYKFVFDADKTFVQSTEPVQDKRDVVDDNKVEPMDVVAEILETSNRHLTPKQIASMTGLNESTVRSCVKRLKDNTNSGIKSYTDGYGYVEKRLG